MFHWFKCYYTFYLDTTFEPLMLCRMNHVSSHSKYSSFSYFVNHREASYSRDPRQTHTFNSAAPPWTFTMAARKEAELYNTNKTTSLTTPPTAPRPRRHHPPPATGLSRRPHPAPTLLSWPANSPVRAPALPYPPPLMRTCSMSC